MEDKPRMGLGNERKYGINRNKYEDFDLDSFLDKAKKLLEVLLIRKNLKKSKRNSIPSRTNIKTSVQKSN